MAKFLDIKFEARQNSLIPINLDYMRERFKSENGISFPSPSIEVIEKNLFFLLSESKKEAFNQKYRMRPDYLSFDKYGTVILGNLLMYVNGVFTVEEFSLNDVLIPSYSAIVTICQDNYSEDIDNLQTVDW